MIVTKRLFHATGLLRFKAQDYYETLGVSASATQDEIMKAFHSLDKRYRPDAINKGDPRAMRKFQDIKDAYENLQNPQKRAAYDMKRRGGSTNSKSTCNKDHFTASFQRIFSEIFDHKKGRFADDIRVELLLTFSEASKGCTKHLRTDALVPCDLCGGRGKEKLCPDCRGSGRVTTLPFSSVCSLCKGHGHIMEDHCTECHGSGVIDAVKDVEVTLPPGLEDGAVILVSKAGNAGGFGMHPGNLYIKIKVAEDDIFCRDGTDVYVNARIGFTQAVLGGRVEVPTLLGSTRVEIPRGVQHGQLLVLRGKGFTHHGVLRGDQYVRFHIYFPRTVNERQRAILEEFAREEVRRDSADDRDPWQRIIGRVLSLDSVFKFSLFTILIILLSR